MTKIWRGNCTADPAPPGPTALLSAWLSAIAGSFGSGLKKRELKKEERKKARKLTDRVKFKGQTIHDVRVAIKLRLLNFPNYIFK